MRRLRLREALPDFWFSLLSVREMIRILLCKLLIGAALERMGRGTDATAPNAGVW
jgi:hypothetical protein